MTKKKAQDVVITPQRGTKAKAKPAPSFKSPKKAGRPDEPMWNTSDLDFDSKGRLVIMNQKLRKAFEKWARTDNQATAVSVPPFVRPPPPPPPADANCGCVEMRFGLLEEVEFREREPLVLDHAQDSIG